MSRLVGLALPLSVGALALGLLVSAEQRYPAVESSDPPGFSAAPVAMAYVELSAAEARNEKRFRDALDPEKALADRKARLAAAAPADLAALGLEVFSADYAGVPRRAMAESTRCASCHHRGGVGGGGGLIDNFFGGRNPPALAGGRLLERLAAEMSAELKAKAKAGQPLSVQGIPFGTADAPKGVAADLTIRPFGRSGRWATLDQAIDAMGKEGLGVTLDAPEKKALAAFIESLPIPTMEPPDPARMANFFEDFENGRAGFEKLGCSTCHVPALTLADGTPVRAYTDLKLHDMGPDLADGAQRMWLTAPLWGLAQSAPYLHDGSALAGVEQAVAAHGGDAASSRQAYAALSIHGRAEVRVFLLSLSQTPRMRIAGQ